MSSDLKNAVRRGVADRLAGTDVLFTELGNDRCPRRMSVAEDSRQFGALAQLFDQLSRKTRDSGRKIPPLERDRHAGEFPMPGRSILALRYFDCAAITGVWNGAGVEAGRNDTTREPARLPETPPYKIRQRQRARPYADTIRFAARASL